MSPAIATRNRIRDLNDAFRTAGPQGHGTWNLTRGVVELGYDFRSDAVDAVRAYEGFTDGNDRYGEHDFGSLVLGGHNLFWKIDYYDLTRCWGSLDPADPTVTRRVLTIMLASEY